MAIHSTMTSKRASAYHEASSSALSGAYDHFRRKAFKLLTHYVENDFQEAFHWLLAMRGQLPKRIRGAVALNPFHFGLLAMTSAAGEFMSRNKLRDLAVEMQRAHAQGVEPADFNSYVSQARKRANEERIRSAMAGIHVPRHRLAQIAVSTRRMKPRMMPDLVRQP